ncbi:MAG: hypothetical protein QOC99_3365 [Acidobacteriota bacterium]|jgi:hypothetical protein|nr:hypothetical protein [Acidobacteriota bacterium]MDT7780853.1 hypothetical protein [Acidobacteriota bacterium]
MPTWLKVVLIIGGLVIVLIVAAVITGVYVARKYGPGLMEAGKQTVGEGGEYGRRTDNEGCLNEAVARQGRSEGFTDIIKNNIFLRACLESSRPTPAFCDSVPRQMEFVKGAQWQLQQCKHYGLTPEKQCGQLFQQVQQFCEQRRRTPAGDADEGDAPPPPAVLPAR